MEDYQSVVRDMLMERAIAEDYTGSGIPTNSKCIRKYKSGEEKGKCAEFGICAPLKKGGCNGCPYCGDSASGAMLGGAAKKKKNKETAWVKHVKAYAKKHKMDYSKALKKARASYKK